MKVMINKSPLPQITLLLNVSMKAVCRIQTCIIFCRMAGSAMYPIMLFITCLVSSLNAENNEKTSASLYKLSGFNLKPYVAV